MGIVEEMRSFEVDHKPDGWPAVRMSQISALCDEVDRRFGIAAEMVAARRERDELLSALECVLPFLTGNYWPGVEADAAVDRAIAVARKVGAGGTAHKGSNVEVQGRGQAQLARVPWNAVLARQQPEETKRPSSRMTKG